MYTLFTYYRKLISSSKLGVFRAIAITACLVLGASMASAATVNVDGDGNVISIDNLEIVNQLEEVNVYNVEFVVDSADNLYGPGYTFDFASEEDTALALNATMQALNDEFSTPSAAGPDGTDQFFIADEYDASSEIPVVASLGGENILGAWDKCDVDCLFGVALLQADTDFTYAVYTAVPVPAAVWLFGSALGLLGIARRRIMMYVTRQSPR
jgi:hypothetical protein